MIVWKKVTDFRELHPGDVVRHRRGGTVYVIAVSFGNRATGIAVADLTNALEWEVRSETPEHPKEDR